MDSSEYDEGIDDATKKGGELANALKSGLKTAGKVGVAAIGAAAAGVAGLAKSSIENYAEYEQLVGGVETLFKTSADTVLQYAQGAYQTAGLSANEYMTTVTSFSASLLQSLGGDTAAAAKVADTAIIDMADNANKMGTSMESIQNAYQGFAKQNYTMLDNLKLGYGGTKEEMERLIADANRVKEANGEMGNLSIESFADVVEAIHTMQSEMGIAGATAQEAEGTISGSIASMKSAWTNLVTGIGDENADMGELIGNFVDSAATAADNLLERADVVLTGIGTAVEKIAPIIVEKIPEVVKNVVPTLLNAGKNLLGSLVNGIKNNSGEMVSSAFALVESLVDGIGEMLPDILVAGVELILQLALGLVQAIPKLVAKIPQIITGIVNAFKTSGPKILEIGKNIVTGIWDGIKAMATWIKEKVSGFFSGIVDGVKGLLGIHSPSRVFASIGGYMAEGLGEGWDDEYSKIKKDIESGMDFEAGKISFDASAIGNDPLRARVSEIGNSFNEAMTIVVQSVLDGKVIGETAYKYSLKKQRAFGG